jgi:outer membrane protein assembly factor BamB
VYKAGGYYGGMYSFDGTSGEQRWFANTSQYDQWTPAVHEDRVYAYTEPKLQVVNAATGTELFSIQDPNFSWNGWSMHVAPTVGSRNNVLATQGGRLISFDLTGERIGWQVSGGFAGPVTVQDGALFVIKSGGVEARNEADGSLLWSWAPPEGSVSRAVIASRNVVFASTENRTYAIDISSRRHTWSYPSGGHLAVTPDGLLLIVEPAGKITAINIR